MKCDFNYCVYNTDLICILDEISLNQFGMCEMLDIVSVSSFQEKHKNICLEALADKTCY